MPSISIDTFLFNLTWQTLASIVILWTFISMISVMWLHNNVVSLVYLLFPHELVRSLLLSMVSWLLDWYMCTLSYNVPHRQARTSSYENLGWSHSIHVGIHFLRFSILTYDRLFPSLTSLVVFPTFISTLTVIQVTIHWGEPQQAPQ